MREHFPISLNMLGRAWVMMLATGNTNPLVGGITVPSTSRQTGLDVAVIDFFLSANKASLSGG
jgi:hypothetical protein